ncbi:PREDICTED: prefoldin subunit 5 isoform X2 [Chrysochloris asiatica]|uniref:Prefoldin subunit 5 isoform X2 n=1 Tax=Chrysochloris asiatica TaxID=185453 RepID=A0A9B0WW14_CHRAS|nr:PREDICTED: prefoldin subunit 5 isoform X2 [Chrysochloris asiatica]
MSGVARRSHRDVQWMARALLAKPAFPSLAFLSNMAQSVNITELNLPQLEMLKNQLDQMYVPGKLHDVEHVLIDVGTGYYVEKTAEDAKDFFKRKIDFLTKQMEKIQPALQEKHTMKQAVMEMMSQKIQQLTALGATQAAAKA